jgi:hypothetical protein
MLLSLTSADAQTSERAVRIGPVSHEPLPELTSEQIAECREQARRRAYPCDDTRGCFSPTSEQLATAEGECRLQRQLQRRANEARKLFEAERESQKSK